MATNPRTFVRLSVYFTNGAANSWELNPKLDKLEEKPTELIIRRGDASKAVTRIFRTHVAYYVVSKHKELEADQRRHPAFGPDDDGIDLRG